MRLSARTVVLSFESSPVFVSPVRWLTDFFGAAGVARVMFAPEPFFAFWFWLPRELFFELDALPMRSLIMSDTSSASAYLRR